MAPTKRTTSKVAKKATSGKKKKAPAPPPPEPSSSDDDSSSSDDSSSEEEVAPPAPAPVVPQSKPSLDLATFKDVLRELVEDDAFIQELHYRYQDKLQSA